MRTKKVSEYTLLNRCEANIPWIGAVSDTVQAACLARDAGISPLIAQLLINRGVGNAEEAHRFLNPSLDHLHNPNLLPDLDAGVSRVAAAIKSGEKIYVHGDYDVDGVTSAAVLGRTLRVLGANVECKLPHRKRDGYDIRSAFVNEAAENGAKVIITCDCGTTACEAVRLANELGIDVIITDHHQPGPVLPDAVAVINPKRHDTNYPFTELAGVGVALKFAQGLVRELGLNDSKFVEKFVDLVALGTVGDVMPLVDENRAIVKHGLLALPDSKKIGLRMLLRSASLENKPITSQNVAFALAPRINAVGRMDDAALALRLMLTTDEEEAWQIALKIERFNTERKVVQDRILGEAIEQVECKDLDAMRVLVLSGGAWNSGVVGIVAGRLREVYGRPTIMLCEDEVAGIAGGSCRSVPGFDIYEALCGCGDLLERFGGHALAAGLSLRMENLGAFEDRINLLAREVLADEEIGPRIEFDAEIGVEQVNRELADMLLQMEPFGAGNPEPLFVTRGLELLEKQRIGDGSHLRLKVRGESSAPIGCVAFRMGDVHDQIEIGGMIDLCYNVQLNSYNGNESVQLVVSGIRNC